MDVINDSEQKKSNSSISTLSLMSTIKKNKNEKLRSDKNLLKQENFDIELGLGNSFI